MRNWLGWKLLPGFTMVWGWIGLSTVSTNLIAQGNILSFPSSVDDESALVGDVNGDGFGDVLVGDFTLASERGGIVLYSGRDGSVLFFDYGADRGDWLGYAISSAGDVDLDGCPDFAAAAAFSNRRGGYVRIYSGKKKRVIATLIGDTAGPTVQRRFGETLKALGDVNGDGHPDLAVADTWWRDCGRVYVFSGKDGAILHRIEGPCTRSSFGATLGCADVDGDGFNDLLITESAPPDVWIYSGLTGANLGVVQAALASTSSADGVGDVDGDGKEDFFVTASDLFGPQYLKLYSGATRTPLWTLVDPPGGRIPASASDLDGDGIREILRADAFAGFRGFESGSVYAYDAKTGAEVFRLDGDQALDQYANVNGGEDVDGDGREDFLIRVRGRDLYRVFAVGQLQLQGPRPGVSGVQNRFEIFGATPNGLTVLVFGRILGSTPIPSCPGAVFRMQRPHLVSKVNANSSGVSVIQGLIPSKVAQQLFAFQALDFASCHVSPLSIFIVE